MRSPPRITLSSDTYLPNPVPVAIASPKLSPLTVIRQLRQDPRSAHSFRNNCQLRQLSDKGNQPDRRSAIPITVTSDSYPTNRQIRQPPAVEPTATKQRPESAETLQNREAQKLNKISRML
ncbi:hypothetical protein [Laspinema olomoucense]|uniref:hypothetical protein n=1 Tax=Laspinema olomoucense TaxID=3231600 RepID=UPI0021BAF486|nr:hypothetical protein [Laspinema sp. D3d]MCT7971229.1 hypothetical protein [Laspinema sp. D3d]